MKSINFKITARLNIKTTKLNVKINYESTEVRHIAKIRASYFGPAPISYLPPH